jgi:hypothetical protein
MVDLQIDVGGGVNHRQTGAKTELGVASDHLVLYYDPDNLLVARDTIERGVRLHNYAKQLKSGMIPKRGSDTDDPLATAFPGSAT